MERWTGPANIAWCEKHGLHGARDRCFECGESVVQIPMVAIAELLDISAIRAAARSLDRAYDRHELTLEEVATAAIEAAVEATTTGGVSLQDLLEGAAQISALIDAPRARAAQPFAIVAGWPRRLICALTGKQL